ncbi:TetR/AcrR family transcriptional regulator [Arthrobacter psychrochitiniphilus]|uniref:TetR family transcriptional regulator n=1 Tax=Arthrobacter psychrochitiniphilus TaxID=291045 RepID=A0A2V3DWK3_9MICC|nr:TetR/AcrR family transcriptional regulator [Arthrobacter psychrochitiniphilus]NYG16643.1 AcrR family transcriptional regulator [Arthrobacter psychrochitiniphilus]PXA69245.1 TetR family transcriptional regulator [Arthrobacter psychrochitiniphilus]
MSFPASHPLTVAPTSRRELNKAATREAIALAALDFLRSGDLNTFTVDDVAEAAGVSRRTFFNYFSSVEAAVASFTQNYLDQVIVELEARPAGEPLLESAQIALSALGNAHDLGILAETFALTQDPQLSRFQLQAWDECSTKITQFARDRMPAGTDELFLFTLVGAVIGGGRAAFLVWFLEHGTDVTQASLSDLRNKLQAAISLIRQGFPN